MRAREGLPSLRGNKLVARALLEALARAHKTSFRVVHFSVQSNHLHLIVEAADTEALAAGMKGLTVRMARAVNWALDARGSVFAERYHPHELRSPRETRAALVYVLQNWRKHGARDAPGFNPQSSAAWFDGWQEPLSRDSSPPIVAEPHTWLVRVGWRRRGLIRPTESPGMLSRTVRA